MEFLTNEALPPDPKEVKFPKKLVDWFILHDRILYNHSYTRSLHQCTMSEMEAKISIEIHELCTVHVEG